MKGHPNTKRNTIFRFIYFVIPAGFRFWVMLAGRLVGWMPAKWANKAVFLMITLFGNGISKARSNVWIEAISSGLTAAVTRFNYLSGLLWFYPNTYKYKSTPNIPPVHLALSHPIAIRSTGTKHNWQQREHTLHTLSMIWLFILQ